LGGSTDAQLADGAGDLFKAGDSAACLSRIAAAADTAYANGADVVSLAHASMAGAAARVTRGVRPLASPQCGLAAAVEAAMLAAAALEQQ
jgi:hypothetical protein